jgi:transcription antitermination factor NusG
MAKRWYVVQTSPGLEQYTADNLSSNHFKVFAPYILNREIRRGGIFITKKSFFANYIFIQFDVRKSEWRSIHRVNGVSRILGASDKGASPLPKGFIEEMKKKATRKGEIIIEEAQEIFYAYFPGEQLEIIEGPLSGRIVTCCNSTKKRVTALLSLLSREIKIYTDPRTVRKTSTVRSVP